MKQLLLLISVAARIALLFGFCLFMNPIEAQKPRVIISSDIGGTGTLDYTITSTIKGFKPIKGQITVENTWDVAPKATDLQVGNQWWTDSYAPDDRWGKHAGANTQLKVREEIMQDWAQRWSWLK